VRYTKRWHKIIDKWLGHTYFHIVYISMLTNIKVIISIFTNIKVIIGNSTKVSSSIFIRRSRPTYIKFRVDVFLNTSELVNAKQDMSLRLTPLSLWEYYWLQEKIIYLQSHLV
jgi:hypothetical protein